MLSTATPTASDAVTTSSPAASLWGPEHRALTLGAVTLVTVGAYEARSVTTLLPAAATDLDGLAWFGLASSLPGLAAVAALPALGPFTDRRGPAPVVLAGLAGLVLATLLAALAPSWWVLMAARALSGLADGALSVGLLVLVARVLPAPLRPRIFAVYATAWILPSILGPALAGGLATLSGWRVAYALPAVAAIPAGLALIGPLRRGQRVTDEAGEAASDSASRNVATGVVVAAALGALTWGAAAVADAGLRPWALLALVGGLVGTVVTLPRALPAGTLTWAPGVASIIGARMVTGLVFLTMGAWIPLMLTTVHGASPLVAGVSLGVTGTLWAAGSNLAGLDVVQRRLPPWARVRVGFLLLAIGCAGPTLLAPGWLGLVPAMVLWAVAAVGMGVIANTTSAEVIARSREDEQGVNNAAMTLGMNVSTAVGFAVGGAVVAWFADSLTGGVFA